MKKLKNVFKFILKEFVYGGHLQSLGAASLDKFIYPYDPFYYRICLFINVLRLRTLCLEMFPGLAEDKDHDRGTSVLFLGSFRFALFYHGNWWFIL